jgi:hypothetical protein
VSQDNPHHLKHSDDEILVVRPLERAFAMIGVKRSLGFEMLADGRLEKVKYGRHASGVTMRSIRKLVADSIQK